MQIQLNQATFRRLVQFYAVVLIVSVAAVIPEFLLPSWIAFDAGFNDLVSRHFGESIEAEWFLVCVALALVALVIWLIASIIGLLRYRRWARFGFWASTVPLFVLGFGMVGFAPSYSSPLSDVLSVIEGALFGAIILMSYANGLGAEWFTGSVTSVEE